jgi:ATP-dependent protease ClpP protease subunit
MKKTLVVILTLLTVVFFWSVSSIIHNAGADPNSGDATDEETKESSICPFTKMDKSCLACHRVEKDGDEYVWGIKEKEWRDAPFGVKFMTNGGEETAYYLVEGIDDDSISLLYEYCVKHGIKHVWLEINSPGGSVVSAWRIIAMMQKYKNDHGIHTTTECLGFAASAGFMVLVSGDRRIASPRAMLMAHELWTLKFLSIETPAGSKDQAEDMDLWQNNINEWLAERSNLSTEEIAEHIHKRDWWMIGDDAYRDGFVDELVWK